MTNESAAVALGIDENEFAETCNKVIKIIMDGNKVDQMTYDIIEACGAEVNDDNKLITSVMIQMVVLVVSA